MIDKKFFQNLKKDYEKQISEREQIIALSKIILHSSKRAIFAMHRNDIETMKWTMNMWVKHTDGSPADFETTKAFTEKIGACHKYKRS